ncbi:MAG: hypothetical protein EPO61_14885 [Nitrospirae bacterium]|nr:MAG: hypothetical protein EPO61_14885 [Nitrospirota bacterium]
MELARLVLEYMKVLFSAPVIFGVVALAFLMMFRKDIAGLIGRIFRIKFPGGSEIIASQQERVQEDIAPRQQPPALADQTQILLPVGINVSQEQAQQIRQLIQSERANAALWEYRYLNLFLVRSTQAVLDWLATLPQPVSRNFFDSFLQPFIPDANERGAIFAAIQSHHLVSEVENLYRSPPKVVSICNGEDRCHQCRC